MKSHAKDLFPLVQAIILDAMDKCSASNVDVQRDLETIRVRWQHEGLSFITITLPDFCSSFEKSLEDGQVVSTAFPGWKKRKCLPAFLQGFTTLVFDISTGRIHDEPYSEAIRSVRQICLAFKKLGVPCSPKREKKAIEGYIALEHSLSSMQFHGEDYDHFCKVSDLLWHNVLDDFSSLDVCPKHGPGVVVERLTQNAKFGAKHWPSRLESYFPPDSMVFCNIDHFLEEGDRLIEVSEESEEPVKVTLVPKTLKGPRIIAIEPVYNQYIQQALFRYLKPKLESSKFTAGRINFTSQEINQRLAMTASSDKLRATLDMSEASDRVHSDLVFRMLKTIPEFRDALFACRSKAARVPSGDVIHLSKFASMGSAVCFPIEAMYFFTIIVASILREQNLPVTLSNIYQVGREVYVYGDDIIIPTPMAECVIGSLQSLGCKVNSKKSFYKGSFRESCGVDAYAGCNVTPTYVRAPLPNNRMDASSCISLIAAGNQFYDKGLYRTAYLLREEIESVLGPLPEVSEKCAGVGWTFPIGLPRWKKRYNRRYQRHDVLTFVPSASFQSDHLQGWDALLKFFIRTSCDEAAPFNPLSIADVDKKNLMRTPRPGTVSMKRRWVAAT